MKILILEDEAGAAQNLCGILEELPQDMEVLSILETVEEAVQWIQTHQAPDLGLFDIHLSDGDSFAVFEKVNISFPIIFTTAYDEYALQAFKVNSVDYLLKPIDKEALNNALNKFETLFQYDKTHKQEELLEIIRQLKTNQQKKYKKSFLVYIKDQIVPISIDDIAYFFLKHETVYCVTHTNTTYLIEQSLERVAEQLNPDDFFRANRQYIVSRIAIRSATQHFHRKLKLNLSPTPKKEIFISKLKVTAFKKWLEMGE